MGRRRPADYHVISRPARREGISHVHDVAIAQYAQVHQSAEPVAAVCPSVERMSTDIEVAETESGQPTRRRPSL